MSIASLQVREYMSRDVVTLSPELDIMSAVGRLLEHEISGAPVVSDSGDLLGMLTERDCMQAALHVGYFGEAGGLVADYMSGPVESVAPDEPLLALAQRFQTVHFKRYPVLEGGRLIGLISRRDALRALHHTVASDDGGRAAGEAANGDQASENRD